jgi:signal peptidase I
MSQTAVEGQRTTSTAQKARRPPRANVSGGRESVESFITVFLFFLVLGVEAEGFVIPTGSMAPTLMGRHKEITCPECGIVYSVNADREINDDLSVAGGRERVAAGTCVNCRYLAKILDEPNFQGDRIYVMKTPINIPFLPALGSAQLARWDVAVFKLPEKPEVRYIKRLVGMPEEVVRILRGDIWIKPLKRNEPFRRSLRPLKHQQAMQILVNDDSHRAKALASDPRWKRWAPRDSREWQETAAQPGAYRATGASGDWAELRYRHVVPDPVQWAAIAAGHPLPHPPRATLITDFYSYNTDLTVESGVYPGAAAKAWCQPHWVGDLTLSCRLDVTARKGVVRFELVKAGVANRCEIDLTNGLAKLLHGDEPLGSPAPTGIDAAGAYDIRFANVDDRLTLWVDGRLPFGEGRSYETPPDAVAPTRADLDPVGIASRGAAVAVSDLILTRDIYYTLDPARADFDQLDLGEPFPADPVALFDWLADPRRFPVLNQLQSRDYPIGPGRYMMLGDNSPWSRDGRAWSRTDQFNDSLDRDDPDQPGWDGSGRERWEVPESLLIGKAFCVYWPHLKPFGPSLRVGRDVRLPARPYVEKMRWIR